MLELQHIHKFFNPGSVNEICLFDDFNLTVKDGEFVSVVGSNGSGKTSMLNIICGSIDIDHGQILIDGKDYAGKKDFVRSRQIGRVFQDPSKGTCPQMTILENMSIAENKGKPFNLTRGVNKAHIDYYREMLAHLNLGLEDKMHTPVGALSGGQRQRIGIARALAVEPSLIIADEPVSALDVSIQAQVLNLLNELKHDLDLTYIFVAHDLSVVEYISDRVGVMYLGNFVEVGEKEKIYSNPMHPYTQALLSAVPVPDPTAKRERILLEGSIPSAHKPPTGCKFHTRCPKCMECCKTQAPERYEVDDGHYVYCHLYDKERREQQK